MRPQPWCYKLCSPSKQSEASAKIRSIRVLSILALAFVLGAANLAAQGAPPMGQRQLSGGPDDWGRNFFPPELVMQHQSEIGLQDSQRATLTSAIQQAQGKFMDMQWKLSAEGEKMGRLLQGAQVDEAQVLEEVDRILNLEREIKKAQISLMVRIKNTLSPAQQAKLAEIRSRIGLGVSPMPIP